MPVYEYRCTQCEHQFELWQEVGAAAPQCPECAAEVKKIFHPVRTIFKGSGFYVTDLRAEQGKSAAPSSTSSTPAATPAATETKSESTTSDTTSTPAPAAAPKTEAKAAP